MLIPNICSYIGFSIAVKALPNFKKSLYKILQSDFFLLVSKEFNGYCTLLLREFCGCSYGSTVSKTICFYGFDNLSLTFMHAYLNQQQ